LYRPKHKFPMEVFDCVLLHWLKSVANSSHAKLKSFRVSHRKGRFCWQLHATMGRLAYNGPCPNLERYNFHEEGNVGLPFPNTTELSWLKCGICFESRLSTRWAAESCSSAQGVNMWCTAFDVFCWTEAPGDYAAPPSVGQAEQGFGWSAIPLYDS